MKYLSVCSGMEAASVAWEPLGWEAVGFSEIEPFPCAILKHRFPNTPNHGDLTKYNEWPVGPGTADVLAGGPPCQAFSVAGLRRGLADPRGNLTLTYLGLVDKLQPQWVVYENVPGLLSVDGGRAFGSFLGALGELGYSAAWRVLDAQHVGECRLHPHRRGQSAVPQRRRRVFVVACRGAGNWRAAAEVLSIAEGMQRHLASGGKKRKSVAADASGGAGASRKWPADTACTLNAAFGEKQGLEDQHALGGASLFVPVKPVVMSSGQANAAISEDKAHTLNATHETQTVAKPIVIDRAAFNQGQNAQYEPHIGESEVMDSFVARGPHAVGQPIPYRKSKRAQSTTDDESWVEAKQSNTLNNFDIGDTRTTHAVVEPHIVQASELRLRGQITEKNVCPTLTAGAKQGDTEPLAVHAIAFQPGNLARQAGADPSTQTFPTLTKDSGEQSPHVCHPVVPLDGMNLLSRLGPCGEEHSIQNFNPGDPQFTLKKGGNQHGVLTPMAVRRLTPVECERLQGFPDNWSRIPWKGKPETECPDGPRYKACGNSMAVPVMRWIGARIAQADAKYFPHA